MARVSQEIILGGKAWLSGRENPLPTLDPLFGGQFGWATNPGEWLSAQSYIPRNLIPIAEARKAELDKAEAALKAARREAERQARARPPVSASAASKGVETRPVSSSRDLPFMIALP